MRIDFYHCTHSPVQEILHAIATKILDTGGRLLIIAQDADMRRSLDVALWAGAADSFLPHPPVDAPLDSTRAQCEPILIYDSLPQTTVNAARHLAIADGVWLEEWDRLWGGAGDSVGGRAKEIAGGADGDMQKGAADGESVPLSSSASYNFVGYERVFFFFTEEQLSAARGLWRRLGSHGGERHYWREQSHGRWREAT